MHLVVDFDDTLVTDTLETTLPIFSLEPPGWPRRGVVVRPYTERFLECGRELFDSVRICSYSPQVYLDEFPCRGGFSGSIDAVYGRELLEGGASTLLDTDFVLVDDMSFNHEMLIRKFEFFGVQIEDPAFVPGCNLDA